MMASILVLLNILIKFVCLICIVALAAVLLLSILEWKKRYDKRQQQIEEVYAKCMEYREREREREREKEMYRRIREREEKKDAGEEGGSGSC